MWKHKFCPSIRIQTDSWLRNVIDFLKPLPPLTPTKTSNKLDTISQARSPSEVQTLPVFKRLNTTHYPFSSHVGTPKGAQAPKQKTSQLGKKKHTHKNKQENKQTTKNKPKPNICFKPF